MHNETIYRLGLSLLKGIGPVIAKNLISYCGSAEAVFSEKKSKLLKVPGVGETVVDLISSEVLKEAEAELAFVEKHNLSISYYLDSNFPQRLKYFMDTPIVLYYQGNIDFNPAKSIAIVGTRNATAYGKEFCASFVADLKAQDVTIVSGLAYGIDIAAHKSALKNDMSTIGVLGHALDKLYPAQHRNVAEKMKERGGLVSQFNSQTLLQRTNFPERNRIIAAMTDATIVVETALSGGSVITADFANAYKRDVFAYPGRSTDKFSIGCNRLIKDGEAKLIESAEDLFRVMGWEDQVKPERVQKQLFVELDEEEQKIISSLTDKESLLLDELIGLCQMPNSMMAMHLLQLEMKGLVRSLPGNRIQLT